MDVANDIDAHGRPEEFRRPQQRPRARLGLIGVATILIGVGCFFVGTGQPERHAEVAGGNVPINRGARDPLDLSGNNSPTLVRNPLRPENLAVASRVDDPLFSCALHVSLDGGASWAATEVPFPDGEEAPPRCYAADAAFGPDGTLYMSFVTLAGAANTPNAVWAASSSDGGLTLGPPARVTGRDAFQVRLVADPRVPDRLHISWLQASDVALYAFPSTGAPVVIKTSNDGGRTWGRRVRVSDPERARVVAPSGAVSRKGVLYFAYLDLKDDRLDYHGGHAGRGGPPYDGTWSLVLATSPDGRTWEESVVDDAVVPTERFVVFLPPFPSLALDERRGLVHVGFHDGRAGDADVWIWTSRDGGSTFGRARRVNDTPRGDGTAQYLPKLAVAPGGRLDVLYYDRRNDRANVMNEVSMQSSFDGARSFNARLRISDMAFDSLIGFGRDRSLPDLGSRLGLVSDDRRALAVWTDTRASMEDSTEQDLALAVVEFESESWFGPTLRDVSVVLVGAGLSVIFLALIRHLRRPSQPNPEHTDRPTIAC